MPTRRDKPHLSDKGRAAGQERQERLARALRENLRRRKAQVRAREKGEETPKEPSPPTDEG